MCQNTAIANTAIFYILTSDVKIITDKIKKLAKFKIGYNLVDNAEAQRKGYTGIKITAPNNVYFETGRAVGGYLFSNAPYGFRIVTANNRYLFSYHK